MITLSELNTLIAEAAEEMEMARRELRKRDASKWRKKWDVYLLCKSYIESSEAEKIEEQRNLLMPKISTIEERVYNDLWSRVPTDKDGRKPKPDLKNPEVKKRYEELAKPYNLKQLKTQLRTLNFILQ